MFSFWPSISHQQLQLSLTVQLIFYFISLFYCHIQCSKGRFTNQTWSTVVDSYYFLKGVSFLTYLLKHEIENPNFPDYQSSFTNTPITKSSNTANKTSQNSLEGLQRHMRCYFRTLFFFHSFYKCKALHQRPRLCIHPQNLHCIFTSI